ncbi:hypothetical protein [Butyrivibrio sp. NC3005]|uniref:hypothetical protein n=1 Tax=Butyrivibrio sp. NC3005 TaxID=1280685 RepID=UPI000478BF50|nr:hypothetical protein [Butyrivibrio sp. NC3005]
MISKELFFILINLAQLSCLSWAILAHIRHSKIIRKLKNCSRVTSGMVKDKIDLKTTHNGHEIIYSFVAIDYLGIKVIKEKTRYREVGEWQNVYYNPANPNEAFSELMRKEILKESLFKAAFTFLFATGLIISIGRYLYVVLMEYGINYIELLKRILL